MSSVVTTQSVSVSYKLDRQRLRFAMIKPLPEV